MRALNIPIVAALISGAMALSACSSMNSDNGSATAPSGSDASTKAPATQTPMPDGQTSAAPDSTNPK